MLSKKSLLLPDFTNDLRYDLILDGTISLKAFISPIKSINQATKTPDSFTSTNFYSSQAGILSSTPNCPMMKSFKKNGVLVSSTPASTTLRHSVDLMTKVDKLALNLIKKRKTQFLDDINEDLENSDIPILNEQSIIQVLSVSRLNTITTSSQQSDMNQQPKVDFTVKIEPNEISKEPAKLTQNHDLKLTQTIDKNANIEMFMSRAKAEEEQLQHKSLPVSQLSPKKQAKENRASLSSSKLKKHQQKAATFDETSPRRSKRVKLGKSEVGVYEFETIKDFKGDDLIVPKLVGTKSSIGKKNASEFSKSCQKTPETSTDAKRKEFYLLIDPKIKSMPELDEKKESRELVEPSSGNRIEFNLFSWNSNLEKKEFKRVSDGVTMFMADEEDGDDGILCLEPGSFCKTQRHTCGVFYVVRKGRCSFLIDGKVTWHEMGDVVKIPKNIRYKIGNNADKEVEKTYVHFQFL